jgi:integrase
MMAASDDYQLALFAPMLLCGLRAAEPIFLCREHVETGWVLIANIPELGHVTKGLRDKRVPLLDEFAALWQVPNGDRQSGLVYVRRNVVEGVDMPALAGASLANLIGEFHCRCQTAGGITAAQRQRIRDTILREAGALTYDVINGEFRRLAKRLKWPSDATLKDLRHLFSTCLANGGLPEHERQYLLGHAPGCAAINVYTHVNELDEHYRAVVGDRFSGVLDIIRKRVRDGFPASTTGR